MKIRESQNIFKSLILFGLAWHYVKYSKSKKIQELEDNAKVNEIGLWQDVNAIPPWEWRANKKKKVKQ